MIFNALNASPGATVSGNSSNRSNPDGRNPITNNRVFLWCDAGTACKLNFAVTGSKRGNHAFAGAYGCCDDGCRASGAGERRRPRPQVRSRSSSARPDQQTVFVSRDETGRTRTKIIVQKRSYLDGGTEVMPGQRGYLNYVIPPYYSPLETALGPGKNFDRMPLNPRWENGWPRMWFP